MVKVDRRIKDYFESLCHEGVTHHTILVYDDLTEKLTKVAKLLKIKGILL